MTADPSSPRLADTDLRVGRRMPLTAAQHEIYLAAQATDDQTAYTTAMTADVGGPVDVPVLAQAIEQTI